MIPKLLHRVWFGGPVPEPANRPWAAWRDLYPDWGMVTWRDPWPLLADIVSDDDMARMRYADLRAPSNIARLVIVARCGGVYVDCDMEPLTAGLNNIVENDTPFFGATNDDIINNAIFGGCADSAVLWRLVSEIAARLHTEGYNADRHSEQTGPYMVTELLRPMMDDDMVHVYIPEVFYPIPWNGPGTITEKSITNHHWWGAPK